MNDVSFLIGKEIGELKARLEHLEGGSAGCGCKGKKQSAQNFGSGRTPLCGKLEKLHPMIVETVNKAIAEALADAGVDAKLYLRNYVLSSAEIRPTEICCYYCSNGDYCCGDCNDPFCRNC